MNITVDQIMSFKPCYTRKKVASILNGRTTLTKQEILDLDIPSKDKVWVLLRKDFLSERDLHLLTCEFAEHALTYVDKPDKRSVKAIEAKRLWLDGKITDDDLEKAREDAHRAAYAAYNTAAAYAAYAADYIAYAAYNTAYAAYNTAYTAHAAYAAAHAAYAADAADAAAAAYAAEHLWQLNRILEKEIK